MVRVVSVHRFSHALGRAATRMMHERPSVANLFVVRGLRLKVRLKLHELRAKLGFQRSYPSRQHFAFVFDQTPSVRRLFPSLPRLTSLLGLLDHPRRAGEYARAPNVRFDEHDTTAGDLKFAQLLRVTHTARLEHVE